MVAEIRQDQSGLTTADPVYGETSGQLVCSGREKQKRRPSGGLQAGGTMIDNPWHVDNSADYERQRIRDEMREIHLQQNAMKAANPGRASSRRPPTVLRTFRRATLLMAKAAMTILLG
jgi:hypothetical protein